jgi:hypothetical protein
MRIGAGQHTHQFGLADCRNRKSGYHFRLAVDPDN